MTAAGLDFVGPSINWFALSPMLVLFGAAMVLLVAGGLFPRWPPHIYALFTAAAGLASMILCFFLWDNITDGGAALLVGNALRFDVFTMIVTITISGALVLTASLPLSSLSPPRMGPPRAGPDREFVHASARRRAAR